MKIKDTPVTKFRAAWDRGDFEDAARLLYDITRTVTDGYTRLSESQAAMLSLKPTKAFRRFLVLCEDPETVKIILKSLLKLFTEDSSLAYSMSKLIVSSSHFPKPTQNLLECGVADTLVAFFQTLPSLIVQATEPPYDSLSLMTTSNLIMTAISLCKSQKDLARKWLQVGVLDKLLETVPFEQGCPKFSEVEHLSLGTLEFVSVAAHLASDLCLAARVDKAESQELAATAVAWGGALLEVMQKVCEDPGDQTLLTSAPGGVSQSCVDAILELFNILADGFKGVFDFGPSIELVRPMLKHIPGNSTQRQLVLEGLAGKSKAGSARDSSRNAARERAVMLSPEDESFMSFDATRKALEMNPQDIARLVDVATQLASFYKKRRDDEDYCQADLHRQPSLAPLALPLLGGLESFWRCVHPDVSATIVFVLFDHIKAELNRSEVPSKSAASQSKEIGVRLLSWLKMQLPTPTDRAHLLALATVGQCAGATWASLAAFLNDHRFLEVCKLFAEAQPLPLEWTEDFALLIMTTLQVPRDSRSTAQEIGAVKEALTSGRILTWVLKMAANVQGVNFQKRTNLLPLLGLCSQLDVEPSAFLTPELLHLLVRQLVCNWRSVKDALLPDLESNERALRCHFEEFDRLAGHLRIIETMICGGRKDTGGKWDPGYLSDLRTAVSGGARPPAVANFIAFCEGEGVAVLVSMFEERKRLQRFRARAEAKGYWRPGSVDVPGSVEAVWELVAAAFKLRRCANQVRPSPGSRTLASRRSLSQVSAKQRNQSKSRNQIMLAWCL